MMQSLPHSWPDTGVASTPWRPRSLAVAPKRRLSRGSSVLLAAIAAGHIGALFLLARGMAPDPAEFDVNAVTEIRFIERPVEVPLEPETILILPPPVAGVSADKTAAPPHEGPRRQRTPGALQAVEPAPATQALALYDENGRVKLPEGLLEDLEAKVGDKRTFDYQVPGLATASKVFDRPPPLVYEHNKFEDFYRPDQNLLNALLTRMVEGTTKEIRIKIPGNPRAKIVCTVSLLAVGGGCIIVQNQGNYVIKDDPATLSEDEQAQCQAWWDKIVDASSQDVWRKTRDLYESECRKPLERKPAVVPGMEPMPGRIERR